MQLSGPPQGSGFQTWRSPFKALLNEFTLCNTLAWWLHLCSSLDVRAAKRATYSQRTRCLEWSQPGPRRSGMGVSIDHFPKSCGPLEHHLRSIKRLKKKNTLGCTCAALWTCARRGRPPRRSQTRVAGLPYEPLNRGSGLRVEAHNYESRLTT